MPPVSSRLVADALERYDLVGALSRFLPWGTANASFEIDTDPPRVMTFHPAISVEDVGRLADTLLYLEQSGFPTSRICPARSGERMVVVDEIPVLLKSFLPGAALEAVDAQLAGRIGALLAELHVLPPPPWLGERHSYGAEEVVRLVTESPDTELAEWLAGVVPDLPATDGLRVGFVHGDLFPDNIIEMPDGELRAIDFEEARRVPLIFDLGMAIAGFAHLGAMTPASVAALIEGYCAQRPFERDELCVLPAMVECALAGTAAERVRSGRLAGGAESRDWRELIPALELSRRWRACGVWESILGGWSGSGR